MKLEFEPAELKKSNKKVVFGGFNCPFVEFLD